ncbi:flavonoid 3-O-glucosyltransferase-like [Benincasa hispida]|uniref:flavonoid 3-O-glucosyltransferase-like n=1 Tax=Benincasa hispida TaxID=102211 RepID=UPI001901351D|nr:flavonoid 3-O-glucosyltransferase-like [Benincasa hispida]
MSTSNPPETTKHVAVLAFPFGTHAGPLLTLVRKLSDAAPDVRFSFLSTAKSNDSIFSGRGSIGDDRVKRFDVGDGLPEGFVLGPGKQMEVMELFLEGAAERFKKGMEAAAREMGEGIGCLISDAFYWFVGEMAEEMKVGWVALWTSGPRPLLVHLCTDLIRQHIDIKSSGSREKSLEFLPGFSELQAGDLPEEVLSLSLDSPFPNMLHKMGHHFPQVTSVLINSFEEIDPQIHNQLNSTLRNYLNIGPLNILSPPPPPFDDHACLPWLDNHPPNSVVYISFGGFLSPPPHELAALAEALQESKIPFLWSFRGIPEEKLPKGILETGRGKIVPWAPQVQILMHSSVGAFVSHGGWNSILESVGGGVPMIGRPFLGDQRMNLKTVENVWGIGVGLEGGVVSKSGVLKAFGKVLGSEEGKLMREKVETLRDLAHKAAESVGSSSQNFTRLVEIVTKSI